MEPPIVVDEHGDIQLYASAAEAAVNMEAVDVSGGEYLVFDSSGLVLTPSVSSVDERVTIAESEDGRRAADDLASRLRRYIEDVGSSRFDISISPLDRLSLDELVALVARFQSNEGIGG